MKKITLLIAFFAGLLSHAQVFTEDFESGSGGYSTSVAECSSGTNDYFLLTNGAGLSPTFTGTTGSYFGAQDIDGCTSTSPQTITWSGINISGCTGLSLSVDAAEDDDGANQDWDAGDFVHIDVSIDGGAFQNVIWFESTLGGTNSEPSQDTDFNGTGDGTAVTSTFQNFTGGITGTGALMVIRITIALDAGDEDIALDNIIVTGTGCGSPVEDCTNGIDDDGDGDIDCADSDCAAHASCTGASGCMSGTLGVTGAGCGCFAGCDLTSFGGPNCSPSVGGNCSAGTQTMQIDIAIPDGCIYTVTADMQNRAGGCDASGADTGDGLKVDIPGGPKPFQTGTPNQPITDSYTLAGPATIRVSGMANRADEIITYTVTSSGPFCVDCSSILPIELTEFKATVQEDNSVKLNWVTMSERENDYFTIERSADGIDFEAYHMVDGMGNSSIAHYYNTFDSSPLVGVSYYRLKQTDFNGEFTYSDIRSIYVSSGGYFDIYPNPSTGSFYIKGEDINKAEITIYNSLGQKIHFSPESLISKNNLEIEINGETFESGVYFVQIIQGQVQESIKLVIK